MTVNADDFRAAAKHTYGLLKPVFAAEESKYYWRLGHSFDTVIDYFATVAPDTREADNFAELANKKYKAGGGYWYDDFAWWAIASLKAARRGDLFPRNSILFAQVPLDLWQEIDSNAPYGWAKADQAKFAAYEPLFDGGVWNAILMEATPSRDCCYPGPECDQLCGRQNTVTNGLYLVLASRLYLDKILTKPAYLEAANREYAFLHKWFAFDLDHDPDRALMYFYDDDREKAVVRERVSCFLSGMEDRPGEGYRSDLAWTGDQGLILGGLVDRMRIVPSGSAEYKALLGIARQILAGTMDYLVDTEPDKRGILLPWRTGDAPGGDDDDYWTGIGVFMRYLLYAYQNNTDLKSDLRQEDAQVFVLANAEYVVHNPDRPQSTDPVVNLTNNLATLVAAVGMLSS